MDNKYILEGHAECQLCPLYESRTQVVVAEGSPDARIMFIGDAPGKNEDLGGHQLHGAAGKNLDILLKWAGIDKSDVIIASMIGCAPWQYAKQTNTWQIGSPKKKQIDQCAHWLDQYILNSRVEIVVPLGAAAIKKFLPDTTISKVHGKVLEVDFKSTAKDLPEDCPTSKHLYVMPMYHPAVTIHKPELRKVLAEDYKLLPDALSLVPTQPPFENYKIAYTWDDIATVDAEIKQYKLITLDYEGTGLDPHIDVVVGVVICTHENSGWYIPTFDDYFTPEEIIGWLSQYIYDPAYTLIVFNKDYEGRMTYKYTGRWINRPNVYDVMLEWYLLSSEVKNLKGLELRELNIKAIEIEELNKQITADYNRQIYLDALEQWNRVADSTPDVVDVILKSGKTKLKKVKIPKFKPPKKVSHHIDMLESSRCDLSYTARYATPDGDLCLRLHNKAMAILDERNLLKSDKYADIEMKFYA